MPEDPTGPEEAQVAAAISFVPNSAVPPGYRQIPVPSSLPNLDGLLGTECVVQVVKDPTPPAGEVIFQSACQRVEDPNLVDLRVLLIGVGTFTWDDTNSGFSLDDGVNYYALDPDTTDPQQDEVGGVTVDRELQFNFVLPLDDHYDDGTGPVSDIDFRVSFTVT